MTETVYITTAIPYINAKPHLGHVLEWFQADSLARFHRTSGKTVAFISGSDENSLKNVQAAEKAGQAPEAWLDSYAKVFREAYDTFGISLDAFQRSSDPKLHWPGVQELWRRCFEAGDIYTKTYTGLYCTGCEAFYTPEELVDGKCPEHLTIPETVQEENYFFALSKYQKQIQELLESDRMHIAGDGYRNEMISFVSHGLEDFSISRSSQRARGVGVPVPNDSTQTMYVWFDALTVYLTAIGWGTNQDRWQQFWQNSQQRIHVIGKGINRFHSVYWIGMLLSAKLPLPTTISVHGYITADGQKMSKSLGNVIDPFELVATYGLEPVRYFLLKAFPSHGDGDFRYETFKESYTADLANGIGNLCSRVAKLASQLALPGLPRPTSYHATFAAAMEACNPDEALQWVSNLVAETDKYLSQEKPWTLEVEAKKVVLLKAHQQILEIAFHLQPFLPKTAETILSHFSQPTIQPLQPLFPRLS